jgi:gamma-glutamyltranspeptidase/glutathione hydrolase
VTNQGGPGVASFTTAEGKAPAAGQLMRNADLAATFRRLAEHGAARGGCAPPAPARQAVAPAASAGEGVRACPATRGAAGFYSGPVADAIVAALQSRGGVMAAEDLGAHATEEAEPISTTYR